MKLLTSALYHQNYGSLVRPCAYMGGGGGRGWLCPSKGMSAFIHVAMLVLHDDHGSVARYCVHLSCVSSCARAVELNLTTEDLVAVEEFAELLRQAQRRNEPKPSPVEVLTSQQSLAQWKEELQQRDDEVGFIYSALQMHTLK